jgi:putative ABC transport system substrate-binding protein
MRGETLSFVVLAAALTAGALAQTAHIPRVAMVAVGTEQSTRAGSEAFREGLAQQGFEEGRTVRVDRRFAEGRPELYPELFADLLREPADVLMAAGYEGIKAAQEASGGKIPVIGYFCGNEVEFMVRSFARPGGNVTGIACLSADTASKKVELLREIVPDLRRGAFLYYSETPGKEGELRQTQIAAERLGVSVLPAPINSTERLHESFDHLQREGVEALIISEDIFTFGNRERLMSLAAERKLPTISSYREFVTAGGLISFGASWRERSRRYGYYLGRVLRGTAPADLPIDQPTHFELVISAPAARALGVKIPPTILVRADEVIE